MMAARLSYRARLLLVFALLALPFIRMLLRHEYGLLHPEVPVSLLLVLAVSAVLASPARSPVGFGLLSAVLIVGLSLNSVHLEFFPDTRLRWLIAGMALSLSAALWLFKTRFYTILAMFLVGSFAADLATAFRAGRGPRAETNAHLPVARRHVIHIVLDEMIGVAGMPIEYPECIAAQRAVRRVLERGNFTVYPHAFSNYRSTRDSLSSILNGRLLQRTQEFFPRGPVLRQNRYFDWFLSQGYAVRVYQSDHIVFTAPQYSSIAARTYTNTGLADLHHIGLPWPRRLYELWVNHLRADRFWFDAWRRALPEALLPSWTPLSTLEVRRVWPESLVDDCRAAQRDTLFFAHLLIPHAPYVYRADGSRTDPAEWRDTLYEYYGEERREYLRRYRQYCEQAQYVAHQIGAVVDRLRSSGLYDSSTIVIHGDHGSRLRFIENRDRQRHQAIQSTTPDCSGADRYDYTSEPDGRDLLNRFSALLAVKPPHSPSPGVVAEPGGVLHFLARTFPYASGRLRESDVNAVYLFEADGSPRRIPILDHWRRGPGENRR